MIKNNHKADQIKYPSELLALAFVMLSQGDISYLGDQAFTDSNDVALVDGLLGLLGNVETGSGFLRLGILKVKFVSKRERERVCVCVRERTSKENVPTYLNRLDALDKDAIGHGDDSLGELGDTGSLCG